MFSHIDPRAQLCKNTPMSAPSLIPVSTLPAVAPGTKTAEPAPQIPQWLHDYLMRRRQALLMEAAEIAKMLGLPTANATAH